VGITATNRAVFSGVTCEWATPQKLFDLFNEEFHFSMDVCATKGNAKCPVYYDKADDALREDQKWAPYRCWMNPPYGPDLKRWMEKAFREAQKGGLVVCLVPARTDTIWWHTYALQAKEIRFLKGRIRFGEGKGKATFPSCLVIFDGRTAGGDPRCTKDVCCGKGPYQD
jgi:phage N-6-adenine-methyltransferase